MKAGICLQEGPTSTRRVCERVLNCKRVYKIKRPSQIHRVKCGFKCFPEESSVSICA